MLTVLRYKFQLEDWFHLDLPMGAQILMADDFYLWAKVDTSQPPVARRFRLLGTGHPMDVSEQYRYISTFRDGTYVWHLFEIM